MDKKCILCGKNLRIGRVNFCERCVESHSIDKRLKALRDFAKTYKWYSQKPKRFITQK